MIDLVKSPEYMREYVSNFYANRPERKCFNGPIPVSFDLNMKVEMIVKEYYNICQRKWEQVDEDERDTETFMTLRGKLDVFIKGLRQKLNDDIWVTTEPQQAEKLVEDYIKKVVTEGYVYSYELAKTIKLPQ